MLATRRIGNLPPDSLPRMRHAADALHDAGWLFADAGVSDITIVGGSDVSYNTAQTGSGGAVGVRDNLNRLQVCTVALVVCGVGWGGIAAAVWWQLWRWRLHVVTHGGCL